MHAESYDRRQEKITTIPTEEVPTKIEKLHKTPKYARRAVNSPLKFKKKLVMGANISWKDLLMYFFAHF